MHKSHDEYYEQLGAKAFTENYSVSGTLQDVWVATMNQMFTIMDFMVS